MLLAEKSHRSLVHATTLAGVVATRRKLLQSQQLRASHCSRNVATTDGVATLANTESCRQDNADGPGYLKDMSQVSS